MSFNTCELYTVDPPNTTLFHFSTYVNAVILPILILPTSSGARTISSKFNH